MRKIRRQNRVLDQARAEQLLTSGEYGLLAMVNIDGGGYGLPFSYVYNPQRRCIYIHCAPQGHKIENLIADNRVTFTVVGATQIIPDKFTTAYSSVMVFGHISLDIPENERLSALRELVIKYSPGFEERAEKYIAGSFSRTAVLRLDINDMSAKAKLLG